MNVCMLNTRNYRLPKSMNKMGQNQRNIPVSDEEVWIQSYPISSDKDVNVHSEEKLRCFW